MPKRDEAWMELALKEASQAVEKGEVPVGAVAVVGDRCIASAHNQVIGLNDPTAHAEILCLRKAAKVLGNYRLSEVRLYVTLEPCWMCAAACVHARISDLIYGAQDEHKGIFTTKRFCPDWFNHGFGLAQGTCQDKCKDLLRDFFLQRRT